MDLAARRSLVVLSSHDKAADASAVFTSCDRLDETVNKLAEHEDARLAPVELSAPDLCVVVEVRLRC